jgi:malic enzyme
VFVITATVLGALRIKEMNVQDILLLLGGSGSIGLTVVLAAVAGGNPNGPFRTLRAIFASQG